MERKDLTGLLIEGMQETDLPEVLEIERLSCTVPWSEILFFNELKNPRSISKVAKISGRVAGYICSRHLIDEGNIINLGVHPDFRRRGISAALVSDIIGSLTAEDCRFIFLEVRASNEAARRLYSRFGFTVMGTRKSYYILPVEDAVMMVWKKDREEETGATP